MDSLYGILVPPASAQGGVPQPSIEASASMAPPPDGAFTTRDELLAHVKNWAASHGYAVVIGRSRSNRLWIRCDRGGEYRDKHANDPSARQRKRKESRLTGCEFSIKASMRKDGVWRSRCECDIHNHGPSEDIRSHPSLRRMTDEQLAKVHELTEANKSPADIMEELGRLWPNIKVIRRDIYNARKNFKLSKDAASEDSTNRSFDTNRSFGDPDRIPAPSASASASWPWPSEADPTPKRRKLNSSLRDSMMSSGQSLGTSGPDGPSSQLALESFTSMPSLSTPLNEATASQANSWSRGVLSASSQRAGGLSPASTVPFSPQSPEARSTATTPMRTSSGDFTSIAAGHLPSSGTSLPPNQSFYSQPLMNTALPSAYSISANHTPISNVQDRRASTQSHVHSHLRRLSNDGPLASPRPSVRQTQASKPTSHQSASMQSLANPSNSTGSSRQNTISLHALVSDPSTLPPFSAASTTGHVPASAPAGPKSQTGASIMMQRMQRVEDELKDQRGVLNQILAAVKSLSDNNANAPQSGSGNR